MHSKNLLTLLILSIVTACSEEAPVVSSEPVLRPVKTMTVQNGGVSNKILVPGVIDAAQKAELAFRVNGKVDTLPAKEGDQVTEGQQLARLEQTDFRIVLDAAKAEFERASAEFERTRELVEKGAISRSEFDSTKAQYQSAKSTFESANQNMKYTSLTAPFSGVIAKRHVENYEDITVNQPVYSLVDLSSLRVKIDVPESIMIRVRDERRQRPIEAIFEEIPEREFPLTVYEFAKQADEETQTFEVTFSMETPQDINILPGMTVSVQVRDDLSRISLDNPVIPANAVQEDTGGRFVFTVSPHDDGAGIIERTEVSIGTLTASGMEITSGLNEGDHVVIAGTTMITEGMRVRLPAE